MRGRKYFIISHCSSLARKAPAIRILERVCIICAITQKSIKENQLISVLKQN